ncbi:MAG: peptidase [Gammaproteobacteria bacterium]|nr:MAG: peptidase [Pseudomonadota bacterium]PIE38717.1 MAG: peptidase [Gammaproteobacteria bacterium]
MSYFVSFSRFLGWGILLGLFTGGVIASSIYLYLAPKLPDVDQLRTTQLQVPLRIYSSDRKLISEFGEKRRIPIAMTQVPEQLKRAFIAAEDNRFYSHQGVDIKGLVRATVELVTTGRIQSGGSTITMQVAKNFFLSREKTFTRKFNEILLSFQIEQELTKEEILELYFNKIYLGNRAYGIGAASEVYYGKPIDQLTVAQMAMIAGLPKAPSLYNPIANPDRSLARRNWILLRMKELSFISEEEYGEAVSSPLTASYHGSNPELEAPWLAEMARKQMLKEYGEEVYEKGYQVYLTIDSKLQESANRAVIKGLEQYDQRHGYKGPVSTLSEAELEDPVQLEARLNQTPAYNGLTPAAITSLSKSRAMATFENGRQAAIPLESVKWARRYLTVDQLGPEINSPSDVFAIGDIVYLRHPSPEEPRKPITTENDPAQPETWELAQLPDAQAAIVSLNPDNGAIHALVGGYSFYQSKYNRVIQANRQPGSNFKPFIYLAAIEKGATAATLINDAPIVFSDRKLEATWRPENSGGKFFGPTRLRKALYQSRNLVSIRLLKNTGVKQTLDYVSRFGFDTSQLPNDLSLALGSAAMPPLSVARGYAIIANGGYYVEPFFIHHILDSNGNTIFSHTPLTLCKKREQCEKCENCEGTPSKLPYQLPSIADSTAAAATNRQAKDDLSVQKIGERIAPRIANERAIYIMHSMLKDVIVKGTGRKAKSLKRSDIAGKTGTTNDQKDAWFSGFGGNIATTVWVGFDQPETLGRKEFGATAALPIWIDYMQSALKDRPLFHMKPPADMVTAKINTDSGLRTTADDPNSIFEIFRKENVPDMPYLPVKTIATDDNNDSNDALLEDIFQ